MHFSALISQEIVEVSGIDGDVGNHHATLAGSKGRVSMPKCPPALKQKAICFPIWLIEMVGKFVQARKRTTTNHTPMEREVWLDVATHGYGAIDPATGYLRPVREPPFGYVYGYMPVFDCAGLKNEEDRDHRMDEFPMMLWTDSPDGRNKHVNPMMEAYTGFTAVQLSDDKWLDVIHPEDQHKVLRAALEGFRHDRPFQIRYRLKRRDGGFTWVLDYIQPWFGPDGSLAGYVGTMYPYMPGTRVLLRPDPKEMLVIERESISYDMANQASLST